MTMTISRHSDGQTIPKSRAISCGGACIADSFRIQGGGFGSGEVFWWQPEGGFLFCE